MLSGSDNGKRPPKEALQNDTELVRSSMYYEHVRHYMKLFRKDKIKVLLFDDLEADRLDVVRDVYRYLGVDDQFPPNVAVRHNPGTKTHSTIIRRVQKIYRSSARLWYAIQSVVPYELRRRIASIGRQEMKTAVQVLIGRNLGAWLDNAPQSQSTVRLDNVHG
jgi:hypothetical protein